MVAAVLADRDQAEDVAQEAFARALMRWPRIGGYELPEAWVRRVALRIAVDSGRRFQPVPGSAFQWVTAAPDDRTFVLAYQSPSLVVRFYLLRLTASGRPGRLTQRTSRRCTPVRSLASP
jgi:predicted RNA polymerase sigma factor